MSLSFWIQIFLNITYQFSQKLDEIKIKVLEQKNNAEKILIQELTREQIEITYS
jgi:hypothetical protein